MVPKPSWLKSNKSHTSVDIPPGQPSPVPSVNNEFQNPSAQQRTQLGQQPSLSQPPLGVAQQQQQQYRAQQQQQQYPQRTTSTSQSHRLSSHDQLQGFQQQDGPPDAAPGFDRPVLQQLPAPVYAQEHPKKSRFSRIAAGLTGGHKDDDSSKQAGKNAIGRRQSTRGKESRPQEYQQPDAPRLNAPSQPQPQQQYHQRHGSQQQLPTSVEQDEGSPGLDPFLQQNSSTPEVPPKDIQYQQHAQHFAPNAHQAQFGRPPLDRVSTEGSYQKQGGVEHYSPDQHQGPQQPQQQTNQPQYQSYPPIAPQPQGSDAYQAFAPQSAPSPRPANAQLHGQDIAQQQRNYYPYQQQQAPQQAQGQSPQDGLTQINQYQQQQFAPPPKSQPQQNQDFRQQQGHTARAASLHQPELQHPQATRGVPQIVQQGQPTDTTQLQQLRPPSSQQPAPPSPLQHQYQPYDQQQNRHSQASDSPTSKISAHNQSQDNMAPSSQANGRIRKVDGAQQPSAVSSRESSLLQQPTTQGQPQGQPPVSPGVATFGANVVPTASQGQPYRGEKQSGETGRATPPPRAAISDLSEEDIEKMMKEHEVLREKYQKVKRYFFDQQTQVHQLQNTLANQRLSVSRTSWDDSEYATRFNRLDGLIAQLSFSIRKDWKSIPPWLHPVVNKNAVEIGKQEMTAVGRAFISHWLVENIFEKYFHPDLEPGFSTQLQVIQLNIRKFAPLCHSTEDEDSLAAKVINWRLATLEGLSDLLRAPQAELNRQRLTETLNEKLIASLQMFLNDPAPPDLAGGVPMMVELAIGIAQHLPLESREVHIEYFPPGHSIVAEHMKMESGIPPLTAPIAEMDEADRVSLKSVASRLDDNASVGDQELQQGSQAPKEDKKRGFFGGLGGSKKPATVPASLGKREASLGQGGSQQSLTGPPGSAGGQKDEPPVQRVRLAVGVAVQIRGKSVLIKAPVYST